ncbi:MAG: serine hydrolase domain-containing protein, partial [Armatimonadota bacterium]
MTRRHFLSTLGRSVAVGALALPTVLETLATAQDAGPPRNANGSTVMRDGIPVSGTMPPQLQAIDDVIVGQMRRYGIPASVVAVSKDGVTVARRGYGYMDKQATKPTIPNAIMRLASLDKTPTATAIRLICEQGWELPRTNKPVTLELPVFHAMAESWGLE